MNFLFVVSCLLPVLGFPLTLTRGPYLQSGTPTGLVVRWRTDSTSDSRVRFGGGPASLDSVRAGGALVTEHEVPVTGLSPMTRYYYDVGTSGGTLAGGDSNHFFVTTPVPGTRRPVRMWAIGDAGTADANQRAVRDAYYNFSNGAPTDVWLMLGDNAYSSGTDAEYQAAVYNVYPTMLRNTVLWPTRGNHEASAAVYYGMFTLPQNGEAGGLASGSEGYYSFDYANVHFICLESYALSRSPTGAMLTWLKNDLAATLQEWVVAYWHHPPYTKGSHNSDTETELVEMRQNALPILESHGADLVLCGHSHSYERSLLLDGHYGTSGAFTANPGLYAVDSGDGRENGGGAYRKSAGPRNGAVYIVAGSSGKTGGGSLDHPVMVTSLNVLGSLTAVVNGNRLDAAFLDGSGIERDNFTVLKDSLPSALPRDRETPPATFSFRPNPARPHVELHLPPSGAAATLRLLGMDGKVLSSLTGVRSRRIVWNFAGKPAGRYLLEARLGDRVFRKKLEILK